MSKPIDWLSSQAVEGYIESLNAENDRGAIILQASTLELFLEAAIKHRMLHLNKEETDNLFGYNAPIGAFSDKIKIGNAMGLFSRQIMSKIDMIREMRNACAHSREPISFQSDQIYDSVVWLVHDMRLHVPSKDDAEAIRTSFLMTGLLIMTAILTGSAEAGHAKLMALVNTPPTSPDTPR